MDNKNNFLKEAQQQIMAFERQGGGQVGDDMYIPPPDMSLRSLVMDNIGIPNIAQQSSGISMGGLSEDTTSEQSTPTPEVGVVKKKANTKKKNNTNNVAIGLDSKIVDWFMLLDNHISNLSNRLDDIELAIKTKDEAKEDEQQQSIDADINDPIDVEFRFGFGVKYSFKALTRHDYDDFIVLSIPKGSFQLAIDPKSAPQDTYLVFDNGNEVLPGFLLGKPFSIDQTSNSNIELLIFLRNPSE